MAQADAASLSDEPERELAALDAALARWRGEPLAGVPVRGAATALGIQPGEPIRALQLDILLGRTGRRMSWTD